MDKAAFEDIVKGMQSRERDGAQIDQPDIEEMMKRRPIRKIEETKEKRRLIKRGLKSK
ncbi:MAG: hypothetical protein LBH05_09270 [Deferribacteraceae bacterium]|jgi:hypothetical protein|nr:hypothetical protein [Deferribacteraceae bacterium]